VGSYLFAIGFVVGSIAAFFDRKPLMALGGFFVVFAAFWSVVVFASTTSAFDALEQARAAGRYKVTEGVVEDYSLTPANAPRLERFRVAEEYFEYRGYHWTPGFNEMASQGGPIAEGLRVRIGSLDGTIVRLEVERPRAAS
jgi:hypothetical protein